jgi:two-component system, OmpR family, response regulator
MRLLLVEDEERLAAALRRGLGAEGFAVEVVGDGVAGLQRAMAQTYDVIVLDVMLPGLSGYSVVRQLRAAKVWTPVLMLSAKDGEFDQADGLDEGADDYLTKPFSFVVLLARLRALVRRDAKPRPTVLRAGVLALDPASRRVTMGERLVELTTREFALLECLLRRPGAVLSKSELYAAVWDPVADGDLNVVEVYVGYLRRKLGVQAVQTIRGAGYRVPDQVADPIARGGAP